MKTEQRLISFVVASVILLSPWSAFSCPCNRDSNANASLDPIPSVYTNENIDRALASQTSAAPTDENVNKEAPASRLQTTAGDD